MKKSEAEILAEVYSNVRGLSKFFMKGLDKIDIHKNIEADGVKFNSAYWIAAHLVWTEYSLIIFGLSGAEMKIEWLNEYSYGSNPDEIKTKPPIDEVMKLMDEVHTQAITMIKNLTDEQLEEDNFFGESFGNSKSKRNLIMHAIRHEPMHIGQLSWILKTHGIKFA